MGPIGIIYNDRKEQTKPFAARLSKYIFSQGGALLDGCPEGVALSNLGECDFSSCQAAIALGGDGTVLATASFLAPLGVPFYGVNLGRLGFLSSFEADQAEQSVDMLLQGEYSIQERMMLTASRQEEGTSFICSALNEVVVNGSQSFRAVNLELRIDGEAITSYNTDGIIVSTATGSTGYSFSAGGPILMEEVNALVVTPLCPHTFFSRPIIAPESSLVEIINRSAGGELALTADGKVYGVLQPEDHIYIRRYQHPARLIHFGQDTLFQRIRTKLYV